VTGIRGRRRRKLLDDLKERRGYSHLKEEALDRTMLRGRIGRGFGSVVRQTTCMNINARIQEHQVYFSLVSQLVSHSVSYSVSQLVIS
jgi:hypothetical protein